MFGPTDEKHILKQRVEKKGDHYRYRQLIVRIQP